jgi:hypothetical protein
MTRHSEEPQAVLSETKEESLHFLGIASTVNPRGIYPEHLRFAHCP